MILLIQLKKEVLKNNMEKYRLRQYHLRQPILLPGNTTTRAIMYMSLRR